MIDLHVHSCVSDGTDSPSEIIRMAKRKKIKAIALTDHDTIEGIEEAELEAEKQNVNFLKGIELSVSFKEGRLIHILGLGIDPSNEYFLKAYNKMRNAREEGTNKILESLKRQGMYISIEKLRKHAAGKYLDRQAILKYFLEKNLSSTVLEFWRRYLVSIPYGEGELLEPEEALYIIKKSGGLSFLAHYHKRIGLKGYSAEEKEEHIKYLMSLGLNGIERYYPFYDNKDIEYVEYLINKYKLIPSGGTDFHGSNRPEVTLGEGKNNFFVPDSIYETIISKL